MLHLQSSSSRPSCRRWGIRSDRPLAAFHMARECGSAAIEILYLAGAPVSCRVTIEGGGELLFCSFSMPVYTY